MPYQQGTFVHRKKRNVGLQWGGGKGKQHGEEKRRFTQRKESGIRGGKAIPCSRRHVPRKKGLRSEAGGCAGKKNQHRSREEGTVLIGRKSHG